MIYIEEITIEGFESHKFTKIKPSDGLNVIVGESNNGKSSILRALKLVYTNHLRGSSLESSINVDEDQLRISIRLSNGYIVIREKNRKTINRYLLINPEGEETKYAKFTDAAVPLEIQKVLGITHKKYDTEHDINFNFLDQIKSSFLVEEVGTTKSKVIGMIRETHYMDAAIREISKDIKRNDADIKEAKNQICEVDEVLGQYTYLDEQHKMIKEIDKIFEQESAVSLILQKLGALASELKAVKEQISDQRSVKQELSEIKTHEGEISKMLSFAGDAENVIKYKSVENNIYKLEELIANSKSFEVDTKKSDSVSKGLDILSRMLDSQNEIKNTEQDIANYKMVTAALENLIKGEETSSLRDMFVPNQEIVSNVASYKDVSEKHTEASRFLHVAKEAGPEISESKNIATKLTALWQVNELQSEVGGLDKSLSQYTGVIGELSGLIGQMDDFAETMNWLTDSEMIIANIKDAEAIKGKKTRATKDIIESKKTYDEMLVLYKDVLKDMAICPTCHNHLDESKVDKIIEDLMA